MKKFYLKGMSQKAFQTRIRTDEVKGAERWIGYCLGPALVATLNAGVGGSYLNSFYTDVLGLNALAGGLFLTLMPVISKIVDAITNIIMGQIVDHTVTPHGKARPWVLIAGPIMAISAILLFAVPASNMLVVAVWVIFSYNLYSSISYTMYNLSSVALIPLSTRDNKQRDKIAMASSIGINMVPGLILAVVFPSVLLPYMGVDQSRWILVMGILGILAIPGTLLQYYFTRERITEEGAGNTAASGEISLGKGLKACLSSKYWVMIMLVMVIYQLYNNFAATSMLYYSNWVLGTYNDGTTLSILNIVGQALLGPGVLVLWPLVSKIGKQKVYVVGSAIAIVGGLVGAMGARSINVINLSKLLREHRSALRRLACA